MRRNFITLITLVILSLLIGIPAVAASQGVFPDVIALPNEFQPEGIAVGRGTSFYSGSLLNGAIYRGDLRTGQGALLVPPQQGRISVGLAVDKRSNLLFVAGGATGAAYVYDAATGAEAAVYQLAQPGMSFINDVIVTRDAAYFTNSFQPVYYRLSLDSAGALPSPAVVEEIALGGDFTPVPGFNANGIEATPNGKSLFIVNTALGALYRVEPRTGEATLIDLGGGAVPNGDGLLLDGKTLYVVQNFRNQIGVVRLDPGLTTGTIVGSITDPDFRIPTTVAEFGDSLYAVNARFDLGIPAPPGTEFEVVGVPKFTSGP